MDELTLSCVCCHACKVYVGNLGSLVTTSIYRYKTYYKDPILETTMSMMTFISISVLSPDMDVSGSVDCVASIATALVRVPSFHRACIPLSITIINYVQVLPGHDCQPSTTVPSGPWIATRTVSPQEPPNGQRDGTSHSSHTRQHTSSQLTERWCVTCWIEISTSQTPHRHLFL